MPVIRAFEASDLDELQRIRAAAFAPVFAGFRAAVGEAIHAAALADSDAEQAALLDTICDPASGHRVLVATLGDGIAGFVAYALDEAKRVGEVVLTAVDPAHAGRGLGTLLVSRALDAMREAGMAAATVGVGGDEAHAPARAAYAKAGFGPAIPSLWMYRLL